LANIKLKQYIPSGAETSEERLRGFINAYHETIDELRWALDHLDSENITDISTDKLTPGDTSLDASLIGAIPWSQITNANSKAVAAWGDSTYADYITSAGVYTGQVKTNQITAGTTKISTSLIDDLELGTNVAVGASAAIPWAQVTGADAAAVAAVNAAGYLANLDTNGDYSGDIDWAQVTGANAAAVAAVAAAGYIVVPAPPASGTFTLTSVNGVMQWV